MAVAAPFVLGCATEKSPMPLYVTFPDAPVAELCHPNAEPMTVTPALSLSRDMPQFVSPTCAALSLLGLSQYKPGFEQSSTEADEGETDSEADVVSLSSEPSSNGVSEPVAPASPVVFAAMDMLSAQTLLLQAVPAAAKAQHVKHQFRKSVMCKHFRRGRCRMGQACNFAHFWHDLEVVPDLTKTKLCYMYFRGLCSNPDCSFAHGYGELRSTEHMYKTEVCFQWTATGSCKAGASCRYAHGDGELRMA